MSGRSFTKLLGSLLPGRLPLRRRAGSYDVSEPSRTVKCVYLGNVQTPVAGAQGADLPLELMWAAYEAAVYPETRMRLTVAPAGLLADTNEHGRTEYHLPRISFAAQVEGRRHGWPADRVFVWIYRQEARRMRQELRCHAVVCQRASDARWLADRVAALRRAALADYKRQRAGRSPGWRFYLPADQPAAVSATPPPPRRRNHWQRAVVSQFRMRSKSNQSHGARWLNDITEVDEEPFIVSEHSMRRADSMDDVTCCQEEYASKTTESNAHGIEHANDDAECTCATGSPDVHAWSGRPDKTPSVFIITNEVATMQVMEDDDKASDDTRSPSSRCGRMSGATTSSGGSESNGSSDSLNSLDDRPLKDAGGVAAAVDRKWAHLWQFSHEVLV